MTDVVELKLDALNRSIELVKQYPIDEYTADVMLQLATELYGECDIGVDEYADILRLYADWLQSTEYPNGRRHAV